MVSILKQTYQLVVEVVEAQLRERQESVRARDGQFCSLASRGKEQVQLFFVCFFLIYAVENMENGHVHRMFQKCFLSGRSCWGV